MANHKITISAKAGPGERSRKNTADQATLRSNCTRNSCMGTAVKPTFLHTSQAAIAIATNKIVQTGANSQLGGVQLGLLRLAYHGRRAGAVNNEPMPAAPRQTTMHKTSRIVNWPGSDPGNASARIAIHCRAWWHAISRKSSWT